MTFTLPSLPAPLLPVLAWLLSALLLLLYLRPALTPAKVLGIFETDGVLSARQLLAWVVAGFGLCMRAAERLDNEGLQLCLEWAVVLFGIGGAVKVADKIKPPTVVNSRKTNIDADAVTNNAADEVAPRI